MKRKVKKKEKVERVTIISNDEMERNDKQKGEKIERKI